MTDDERIEGDNASTLAVRHIINPHDEDLVDVSNVSPGMSHDLTMIKSYDENTDYIIGQIRARQEWYIRRYFRRNKPNLVGEELKAEVDGRMETVKKLDPFDRSKLFTEQFFLNYCHVSRGKEFKLAEKMVILADTDLQNRSGESDGMGVPLRNQ